METPELIATLEAVARQLHALAAAIDVQDVGALRTATQRLRVVTDALSEEQNVALMRSWSGRSGVDQSG